MDREKGQPNEILNARDNKILSVHNRGNEGLLNGYAMSYPIYEYFVIPNNVLAYLKGHHHEIIFVFGRESLLIDIRIILTPVHEYTIVFCTI